MTQGIVNIRGKEYHTVAKRVDDFRQAHPAYSLTTAVVLRDDECVVMSATIADESGRVIATGHAEEYRASSQINRTSALENAETSAIGRALAAFGIGGTEFASANEVQNAIHQQDNPPAEKQPAHSALKSEIRKFASEMDKIGTWEEWCGLRDSKLGRKVLEETPDKLPNWWNGWPEQPDGFTPLKDKVRLLEANLADEKAAIATA